MIDRATAHRQQAALRTQLATGKLIQHHGALRTREQIAGRVQLEGGWSYPTVNMAGEVIAAAHVPELETLNRSGMQMLTDMQEAA